MLGSIWSSVVPVGQSLLFGLVLGLGGRLRAVELTDISAAMAWAVAASGFVGSVGVVGAVVAVTMRLVSGWSMTMVGLLLVEFSK